MATLILHNVFHCVHLPSVSLQACYLKTAHLWRQLA